MSGVAWGILAAVITLAVLLLDLACLLRSGVDGTLSACVRRANKAWPLAGAAIGFAIGALLGHWFW